MMCIFCGVFWKTFCVQIILVEESITKCVVTGGTVSKWGDMCRPGSPPPLLFRAWEGSQETRLT